MEAKLLQHITGMQQEVLYEIFVDIQKDYDVLYQGRALTIQEEYGVEWGLMPVVS